MRQVEAQSIAYAEPKRIESLDSIRGLAALAVLIGHAQAAFAWPKDWIAWTDWPILNMLIDGRSAVTMFFVLSGFVLTHPYLAPVTGSQQPRQLYLPAFYLRRILRIWIPWFVAFLLSLLARNLLFTHPVTTPPVSEWFAHHWQSSLTVSSFCRQCIYFLHDANQQLLPQDWSLGVELKGSALIPLFLFVVRRSVGGLIALTILFLIVIPTGPYYASFALGVLVARYHQTRGVASPPFSLPAKCALLIAGILLYESRAFVWYFRPVVGVTDQIVWCVASVGCAFIIIACLGSRRIQSKLKLPLLTLLGKISYSVYLLQFIVILCFLPPFVHWLNTHGVISPAFLLPLTVGFSSLLTVGIALVLYRTIEAPTIDLGRWITHRIEPKKASS